MCPGPISYSMKQCIQSNLDKLDNQVRISKHEIICKVFAVAATPLAVALSSGIGVSIKGVGYW